MFYYYEIDLINVFKITLHSYYYWWVTIYIYKNYRIKQKLWLINKVYLNNKLYELTFFKERWNFYLLQILNVFQRFLLILKCWRNCNDNFSIMLFSMNVSLSIRNNKILLKSVTSSSIIILNSNKKFNNLWSIS